MRLARHRPEMIHKGTSKNSASSPNAIKLPANDSASFSFRFIYVHSGAVSDRQWEPFFEVPIRLTLPITHTNRFPHRNKQFTVRGYDLQFTSESNRRCETIIFGIGLTRDRPASNNSRHFLGVGGYPLTQQLANAAYDTEGWVEEKAW